MCVRGNGVGVNVCEGVMGVGVMCEGVMGERGEQPRDRSLILLLTFFFFSFLFCSGR